MGLELVQASGLLRSMPWAGEQQEFLLGEELDKGLLESELPGFAV